MGLPQEWGLRIGGVVAALGAIHHGRRGHVTSLVEHVTRDVTSAADTCQLGLICGEGPRHVTHTQSSQNFLCQNIRYICNVSE